MELQSLRMEVRKLHSSLQGKTKPTLKPSLKTPQKPQQDFQYQEFYVLNTIINLDYYPPVLGQPSSSGPACEALATLQGELTSHLGVYLPDGYYKAYDNTTDSFSYVYCSFYP